MGILEAFLAAAVAGLGLLLALVALMAWRRARDRKMAVLAGACSAQAVGGFALLGSEFMGGTLSAVAPTALALAALASLALLYAALFARRAPKPGGTP